MEPTGVPWRQGSAGPGFVIRDQDWDGTETNTSAVLFLGPANEFYQSHIISPILAKSV